MRETCTRLWSLFCRKPICPGGKPNYSPWACENFLFAAYSLEFHGLEYLCREKLQSHGMLGGGVAESEIFWDQHLSNLDMDTQG